MSSRCPSGIQNAGLLEVLKQAKTTRHPWLAACDSNMGPEDFEKSLWVRRKQLHVVAPKKRPRAGEMEVVEDFESRPHEAVSFVVIREKGDTGME